MAELLNACMSPVNLVLSVLLLVVALYWIMVIVGAVGMDTLDVDLAPEADALGDVSADTSVDVHHGGGGGGGLSGGFGHHLMAGGVGAMRFFNVGEVPLMFLLSIAILAMWAIGVLLHPWMGEWAVLLQLAMLVPIGLGGLLIAKIVTTPFKAIFRKFEAQAAAEQDLNLIGRRCRVISGTINTTRGQVEVGTDGAPLLLNARTSSPDITLSKGDEAVILSHDEHRHVYLVRGF